jgi:hypothetical protein
MKGIRVAAVLAAVVIGLGAAGQADAFGRREKPLARIVLQSEGMHVVPLTDAKYNRYFGRETASQAIPELMQRGKFYINGKAVPVSGEALADQFHGTYTVNGSAWLQKQDNGFLVDKKVYPRYEEALPALAARIPAGVEISLYDHDGNGAADEVMADVVEAFIPSSIVRKGRAYEVRRLADSDFPQPVPGEGRRYDGTLFTAENPVTVPDFLLDKKLKAGDMALFSKAAKGWHVNRARAVTGILEAAADHEYYQIDGIKYHDAMRFSRDNLPISNRCGEFIDALKYFGFVGGKEKVPVTLWFVPTRSGEQGAPAGFTSGKSAPIILKKALSEAKKALSSAVTSEKEQAVPKGHCLMTQENYAALSQLVQNGEKMLQQGANPVVIDYENYLLYLALNGSSEDIGARYAGYRLTGVQWAK